MGQLYDANALYDADANYDDGPAVPIVAPTKITPIRLVYLAGVAEQSPQRFPIDDAIGKESILRITLTAGLTRENGVRGEWRAVQSKDSTLRLQVNAALAREAVVRAKWAATSPRVSDTRLALDNAAARLSSLIRCNWAGVLGRQAATALAWGAAIAKHSPKKIPWAALTEKNAYLRIRWRPGYPFQTGYTLPFAGEPDPPPGSTIIIPPSEVYFMIPALSILRDSDSSDLNAIDASIRLDVSSYAFTLDATIPRQTLNLVDPNTNSSPVLVDVSVNGYSWKFIIEGYTDNRKFGGTGCKIRGRSASALLGAPYAPRSTFTNSAAKNASQLATDLMPTGWTCTWSTQDWLVPAGLFTYAELTPIDALALLVNAVGGMISPDPATQTLTILPLYPTSPWNWGAPVPAGAVAATYIATHSYALGDLVIPTIPNTHHYVVTQGGVSGTEPTWPLDGSTVTSGGAKFRMAAVPYATVPSSFWTELSGQWDGNFKTAYNGIYVSGQNSGKIGKVKRTGTAGDVLLPTVTDALLCVTAANTERGRIELAKADRRKTEQIRTILLPPGGIGNPGVFLPGKLLQISERPEWSATDWLGEIFSIQIDAVHSSNPGAAVSVRQLLSLERHE